MMEPDFYQYASGDKQQGGPLSFQEAGASIGHDDTWDAAANLNARIGDGVIAITQANPKADWNAVITAMRGQLQAVEGCPTGLRSARYEAPGVQGNPEASGLDMLGRRLSTLTDSVEDFSTSPVESPRPEADKDRAKRIALRYSRNARK